MNGTNLEIIKWLVGICAAALIGAVATMYVGRKNSAAQILAARIKAETDTSLKQVDGIMLLKTAEVNDRTAWEARVLEQYDRLDKKLQAHEAAADLKAQGLEAKYDEERTQRRRLEGEVHTNNLQIKDLQSQLKVLNEDNAKTKAENEKQRDQIIRLNDEQKKRQGDCEERISKLHDELVTVRKERDEFRRRLEFIETAKHIGGLEVVEQQTKAQVRQADQKVEQAEKALDTVEHKQANGEDC